MRTKKCSKFTREKKLGNKIFCNLYANENEKFQCFINYHIEPLYVDKRQSIREEKEKVLAIKVE